MAVAVAALIFFAVVLSVVVTLSILEERREARESLRQLLEYEAVPMREHDLLASANQRIFRPVFESASRAGRSLMPAAKVERVERALQVAGSPPHLDLDRYLALKVAAGVALVPMYLGVAKFVPVSGGLMRVFVTVGLWALLFFGPDVSLKRMTEARRRAILLQLPDLLDLLVVSVEAGLGFEQALDRTIANMDGVLPEEFNRLLQETRMGASRHDALRALDERTDVAELRSFVTAMIQADTFGVSITRVLRAQAHEIRVRRRQRVEEAAHKMPVTMLFPMILCIFPSIFVVAIGPAAINIMENL